MSAATENGPLRWGVVGPGRIGRTVMSELLLLPDAELTAVCSRSRDRAAAFAADLEVPEGRQRPEPVTVTSVEELLPLVDVVYVATPHLQHPEAVLPALQAGVPVLCEKAVAARMSDAQRMVDAAREHRTLFMEAMWMRFNPLHRLLVDELLEGIGPIRRITADLSVHRDHDPDDRLWDPARGGGTLLDLGVYPVSFVQWLLGTPLSVAVHGERAHDVDASATLLLRYPEGNAAQVSCSFRAVGTNGATVVGERGRVVIDPMMYKPHRIEVDRAGEHSQVHVAVPGGELGGRGYTPMLMHFQELVRSGATESPVMPLDDTLAVMRILTDALDELGVSYPSSAG
ncbi:gfo/Idh/MocA family oxidoreductase [Nakamurella sp. YIM 132087]|uniref:Gfo/Idh/MocA family oxidoreductase n=1 Tax=Nakamurella alba TaxID=2665158 RepID=A0A7K1FL37_9ACTN|nr:Gfo/Idh/MocA family oxidoreductase [Nakamurella alba]MTD14862.1 gfo/Idh/MocA family oxidoreductase [Nakamurella alba]